MATIEMEDTIIETVKTIETIPPLELTPSEVEDLSEQLHDYHAIYSPLFARREQREWSEKYLLGLLSDIERKSIEPMVLELFEATSAAVRAMQQFIGKGAWEDSAILKQHWHLVDETIGCCDGVLIVDGSDFPKQGKESVGVKRQYCGQLGKVANCQAGVFVGYASDKGYTLLDRSLYLPEEWVTDEAFALRREKCGVPDDVTFATKPQLAQQMIAKIVATKTLRGQWVACDEGFGRDTVFLDAIDDLGRLYFAEVPHDTQVWTRRPMTFVRPYCGRGRKPTKEKLCPAQPCALTACAIAERLASDQWERRVIKEGSKGPMVADFACLRVVAKRDELPGDDVWLILRRNVESGELKTYLSNAPIQTDLATFAKLSGMRWPIETGFEQSKQMLGMGDYEVRSWLGWHHHMTLVILAHFFLVLMACRLKKKRRR